MSSYAATNPIVTSLMSQLRHTEQRFCKDHVNLTKPAGVEPDGVSNDLRRKAVILILTWGTGEYTVTTAHHRTTSQEAHNLTVPTTPLTNTVQ